MALPYLTTVVSRLADLGVPLIVYVRNAAQLAQHTATCGCAVVALDATLSLADAHARLPRQLALQGNFDPGLLHRPATEIAATVQAAIGQLRGRGYIVNLGQGLTPDSPIEGVAAFVQAVQTWMPS